jgi:hypothetical protein
MSTTPHSSDFLGVIRLDQIASTDKPDRAALPTAAVASNGVFLWRMYRDGNTYDIYADYKGRGFWVIDGETGEDLSGPIHGANWQSLDAVVAAVATVHALSSTHRRRRSRFR